MKQPVLFDNASDIPNPLTVKVTPKARLNKVMPIDADGVMKIYVTTAPEDGKANAAVIKLLSQATGLSKSCFTLTHGSTARIKTFRIDI
jgi:uncharacterized protein YggU (UPF0235/DUF167 family)